MDSASRQLPSSDADSAAFWEGCRSHQLKMQKCLDCGAVRHYPRAYCPDCLSPRAEWTEASGRGRVYSFVVVHRALDPAFQGEVPYVVALVELEEGPRMLANLQECPPDRVEIGMPVRVIFEKVSEEFSLPQFRPAEPP